MCIVYAVSLYFADLFCPENRRPYYRETRLQTGFWNSQIDSLIFANFARISTSPTLAPFEGQPYARTPYDFLTDPFSRSSPRRISSIRDDGGLPLRPWGDTVSLYHIEAQTSLSVYRYNMSMERWPRACVFSALINNTLKYIGWEISEIDIDYLLAQ